MEPIRADSGGTRTIQRIGAFRRMFRMWREQDARFAGKSFGKRIVIRRMVISRRHNNRSGVFKTPSGTLIAAPVHWWEKGWKLLECPPDLVDRQSDEGIGKYLTPVAPPDGWQQRNAAIEAGIRDEIAKGDSQQGIAASLDKLAEIVAVMSGGIAKGETTKLAVSDNLAGAPDNG